MSNALAHGTCAEPSLGAGTGRALEEVLVPIPRRPRLTAPTDAVRPPRLHTVTFDATFGQCVARLALWLSVIVRVVSGRFVDKVRGRDTIQRRAERLREALERVGGTPVKLGQQIAMRIDMLPWEYGIELSKMLDRMRPFGLEQALAAVERAAGRPWQDVFSVFDPEPVGSASVACVYQATLKSGTKVAVKVRRPGIGETFIADFRVLDWLCAVVEGLGILRPGFTTNVRRALRDTLLEELDFRKEAYFQHIFRRNARRHAKKDFFTAPAVHFELSNDEVIVQEFVSGMWLWELIAAIESADPAGQAMMQRLHIDPALVARRILWAAFWSMDENLFFHADPHPANIVVGPDSTLTFVDFGCCGSFDNEHRWAVLRLTTAMEDADAEGMARAVLKLMEPFPPLDIAALTRELRQEYLRVIYTFRTKAKHTQWWERTSARQWMAMVKTAREFNLPLNVHTLRMIRATLLYDTLVVRLDHTADRFAEYQKFLKRRGRWARARWRKRQRESTQRTVLRIDELLAAGNDLIERAQHTIASPVAGFSAVVDKSVFAFTIVTRMTGRLLFVIGVATGIFALSAYFRTGNVSMTAALAAAGRSSIVRLVALAIVAVNARHILLRIRDRDINKWEAGR
jgi:ubiquinone biosynthesis protein